MSNTGKFRVVCGILNVETGKLVPPETPVFMIIGSDRHAPAAIADYANRCENENQRLDCMAISLRFSEWQEENPDRVHEPDGRE